MNIKTFMAAAVIALTAACAETPSTSEAVEPVADEAPATVTADQAASAAAQDETVTTSEDVPPALIVSPI